MRKLFDKWFIRSHFALHVDSYYWVDEQKDELSPLANYWKNGRSFNPVMRVRFSTSHPKTLRMKCCYMKKYENICKYIHSVQSGLPGFCNDEPDLHADGIWQRSTVSGDHAECGFQFKISFLVFALNREDT